MIKDENKQIKKTLSELFDLIYKDKKETMCFEDGTTLKINNTYTGPLYLEDLTKKIVKEANESSDCIAKDFHDNFKPRCLKVIKEEINNKELAEKLRNLMIEEGKKLIDRKYLLDNDITPDKADRMLKNGFRPIRDVAATRPFYYRIPLSDARCFILASCLPDEYLYALAGKKTIEFQVDEDIIRFKDSFVDNQPLAEATEESIKELIKIVLKFKVPSCKVSNYDIENLLNLKDSRVEEIYKEVVTLRDLFCKRNVEMLESCVLDLIDFGNDIMAKEDKEEYRGIILKLRDFFENHGAPESLLAKIEWGI